MRLILFILLSFWAINESYAIPWVQKANIGAVGRHRAVGFAIGNKG